MPLKRRLVLLTLIAAVAILALAARNAWAGWSVYDPNSCQKRQSFQPQTISCKLFNTHSIHVLVWTTAGAQSLKWVMNCDMLPIIFAQGRLSGRPKYDFWIDQRNQYTIFDLMSFSSCRLKVQLWLKPSGSIAWWHVAAKHTG